MFILDNVKFLKDDKISIPFYHRGSLSLKKGTEIHFCIIPKTNNDNASSMVEMVVSTIEFDYWKSALRINGTFYDMPGIIYKIMRILKEENINILLSESCSMQNRKYHQVEIIVDGGSDFIKEKYQHERLNFLERRIASLFENDELPINRGKFRLQVRRMKGVYAAALKYDRAKRSDGDKPISGIGKIVENGNLIIKDLDSKVKNFLSQKGLNRVQLVSDTKERLLSIFYPNMDEHFMYVRISHKHIVGALSVITGELAKAFNIINHLCRRQTRHTSHFEALLYCEQFNKEQDGNKLKKMIHNMFASPDFSDWDLKISFPNKVGEMDIKESIPTFQGHVEFKEQKSIAKIGQEKLELPTYKLIKDSISNNQILISEESNFDNRRKLMERNSILSGLLSTEEKMRITPKLFLSYEFSKSEIEGVAKKMIVERQITLIDGKSPNEYSIFRKAIVERIKNSQIFLGIWTKSDHKDMSSWFFWELGVAEAFGLPCRLLVHEDVSANIINQINPERNHEIFTYINFKDKLRVTLDALTNDYNQYLFSD